LRADDIEIVEVTESFNDLGKYSIERIATTPEANRPGAMRAPHLTVTSSLGSFLYNEDFQLMESYPLSDMVSEMIADVEEAYHPEEGFPLVTLLDSTSIADWADTVSLTSFEAIQTLPDGSIEFKSGDTLRKYSPTGSSMYEEYFDYDLNRKVSSLLYYEKFTDTTGRLLYSVYADYPILESGDTICRTTIVVNDYGSPTSNPKDKERNEPTSGTIPPLAPGTVQVADMGSEVQLRWMPSDDEEFCISAEIVIYSMTGAREASFSGLSPGQAVSIHGLAVGPHVVWYRSCNGISSAKIYVHH
jgi:hypothetical protein